MKEKVRLFFAIFILAISIALLVWGYAPNPRETHVQPISPSEMQLPTPSSLLPYLIAVA
jgi:hypothetical protein